ncbi:mucin-5AC-like isoform X2 [Haliotis rufescens]|uniref:mucin-5AC-like isoform X2 n=1 Tax=Haliotis rufescens TaxID=6454 RepID=UPI00201F8CAB|nr:mucin-5AC-like isoform X2 [Haliotis rufescens]
MLEYTISLTDTDCPGGVALLGSEYTIEGDRSNYTGFIWVRPTDGRYVVTCNPSCSPVAGYSATMNDTHSTLTIHSVGLQDVGTWRNVDATITEPIPVDVCQLTTARIPQCNISSDEDTDSLEPGAQLTLTVNITGYYCSREAGFDLTTGAVTEALTTKHNVSDVSNSTLNTTFNVDITRLGDVSINFICDRSWTLTGNGVQKLLKTPPQCNISSDTDTNALEPGTNLTLTIDIQNYYCSQQAGFYLTTGRINNALLENQTMDNITDAVLAQPLNVTADHFGDVDVIFLCDNITRTLICAGVDKLSEAAQTTETTPVTVPDVTTTSADTSTVPTEKPSTSNRPTSEPSRPTSTPSRPTATEDTDTPTDATLGLAIGLSLPAAVLLILAVVFIVRYRNLIGKYIVTTRDSDFKQTDVHAQQTDVHAQQTDVHAQQTDVLSQQTDVLSKQTDVHAQQTTSTPNRPTSTPNRPTSTPNRPTSSPNRPTSSPNRPTSTPNRPTSTPNRPTPTPNRPTSTPNRPTSTPNRPTSTPNRPTSTPNRPTSTPNRPTPTPSRPTSTPNRPTPTPSRPTATEDRDTPTDATLGLGVLLVLAVVLVVRYRHVIGKYIVTTREKDPKYIKIKFVNYY